MKNSLSPLQYFFKYYNPYRDLDINQRINLKSNFLLFSVYDTDIPNLSKFFHRFNPDTIFTY